MSARFAFGLAAFIVGSITALIVAIRPDVAVNVYISLIFIYASVVGLLLALPGIPELVVDAASAYHETKRHLYEARTLGQGGAVPDTAGVTVENASKAHIGAWRAWWLEVFVYAAQNGGVVSWKDKDGKGLQNIVKRHEHWLNYVVGPFNSPQHRWLEPAYQGGKTKLREGVSVWFIVNELSRGNCPPPPLDAPPALKSGEFETQETPVNYGETVEKELQ